MENENDEFHHILIRLTWSSLFGDFANPLILKLLIVGLTKNFTVIIYKLLQYQ